MRLSLFLLIPVMASPALAQRQVDPVAAFYSNTWNVYSAEGVHHYFVNSDHSWKGTKANGELLKSGTWRIKGGKVCFHILVGPTDPEDDCFAILGKKIGDTWMMDVDTGGEVVAILHKGRQ